VRPIGLQVTTRHLETAQAIAGQAL